MSAPPPPPPPPAAGAKKRAPAAPKVNKASAVSAPSDNGSGIDYGDQNAFTAGLKKSSGPVKGSGIEDSPSETTNAFTASLKQTSGPSNAWQSSDKKTPFPVFSLKKTKGPESSFSPIGINEEVDFEAAALTASSGPVPSYTHVDPADRPNLYGDVSLAKAETVSSFQPKHDDDSDEELTDWGVTLRSGVKPSDTSLVFGEKVKPNVYEQTDSCGDCGKNFGPGDQKITIGGQSYHRDCFVCKACRKPIGTEMFFPLDNDVFCSIECQSHVNAAIQESEHKKVCVKCGKKGEGKLKQVIGKTYCPTCFTCKKCDRKLLKTFIEWEGHPYCVAHDPSVNPSGEVVICAGCETKIIGAWKNAANRKWHQQCFRCWTCKHPITGGYQENQWGSVFCPRHAPKAN